MHYLSACCIVKDEDPFLHEWLTYHALLGVEHFYIYDNESARPAREHPAVQKYLRAGRATVFEVQGKEMQIPVYDQCLELYGKNNKWIAFIDLDEFICLQGKENGELMDLRPLLAEFEAHNGLALNWLSFTSAGLLRQPSGLVIENYPLVTKNTPVSDFHVKSVVRAAEALRARNAHVFYFRNGQGPVNENRRPLPPGWPYSQSSHRSVWLNHYHFKSQEDYEYKIARGRADLAVDNSEAKYKLFYGHIEEEAVENRHATSLGPLVEKWMRLPEPPPLLPEITTPDNFFVPGDAHGEKSALKSAPGLDPHLQLCLAILDGKAAAEQYPGEALSREQRLNRAQAALCRAALYYENDIRLWVMRAMLARLQRNFGAAEGFINRAIGIDEHPFVYEELFHLTLVSRGKREAAKVLFYMENLPRSRVDDEGYKKKLQLLGKMVL